MTLFRYLFACSSFRLNMLTSLYQDMYISASRSMGKLHSSNACTNSKGPDQAARPRSLIRSFAAIKNFTEAHFVCRQSL